MKRGNNQPTARELDILNVLWQRGPSSVRQVRDAMSTSESDHAYTTILTLMQIMVDKGLATRDETARTHVYAAAVSRPDVETAVVGDVITRLFGGSGFALAAKAVEVSLSPSDRQRLKELLADLEEGGR
ncbi:MAG: BlaI/MecI/CopY family transcriptional regulator [Trueperaceae bacterium]|nr:BlaI/MecI/CopY family transcriptional regulator [Trueperaceae bacterium]